MFRKLNLVVLATLILLASALLVACTNEDAAPDGLSRAWVEEIVRAEAAAAAAASQPGLSRAEVEEIARAAVPQPEAEPGLSRSEVEEIARAAMPQPEAEPGLTRAEVEEIVQAAMAEAAEPASASCQLVPGQVAWLDTFDAGRLSRGGRDHDPNDG